MFGGAIGDRIDIVFSMSGLPAFTPEYENAIEESVSRVTLCDEDALKLKYGSKAEVSDG